MSKHYLACTANELDEAVEKVLAGYKDVTPVTASAGDVIKGKKIVDATGKVEEGTLNTDDYYNDGYTAGVVDGNATGYAQGYEEGYEHGQEDATPTLQSKEVIPSLEVQEVTADTGFDGLSKVTVESIPQSYTDEVYQSGYDDGYNAKKPYKCELPYIQFTGTQYILTAFRINGSNINSYKIVADMAITGSSGWRVSGSGGTSPILYFGIGANNTFAYGNGTTDVQTTIAGDSNRHLWTLDCKNKTFTVDNLVSLSGIDIATSSASRTFVIGGYATSDVDAVGHPEIVYGYMFYENDVLVGHYIPVLDWDDVPCMYDKVNNEFYYSAGTGSFICPINVPVVKSITTSGTYDSATYHGACYGVIDFSGNLFLVVTGGTSTAYESIYFVSSSVPSGVSLVNKSVYTTTAGEASMLYVALFSGITGSVNIALNFSARNSTDDYTQCDVTITYA